MSEPALLFWNSLGAKPHHEELDKALQAEIRDPLWILCRQWQMGEFRAEDAAAPVEAHIRYQQAMPAWISGRNGERVAMPGGQPLNHWVEATAASLSLSARVEIGQQWHKLLQRKYTAADQATVQQAFADASLLHFQLPDTTERLQQYQHADLLSNTPLYERLIILQTRRIIDGGRLLDLVLTQGEGWSATVLGAENAEVNTLGQALLAWARRIYSYQIPDQHTWQAERLEYQFQLEVPETDERQIRLQAKEYPGGQLSWYQFDAESTVPSADDPAPKAEVRRIRKIPVQVDYLGMPKTRWWEMEDSTVNFGHIKTDTTNPARLLFTQFSLVYGNDWFLLPLEVEIGALTEVQTIIVRDNFGLSSRIDPTPGNAQSSWGFYPFHPVGAEAVSGSRYFYTPSAEDLLQSEPVEQVNLVRDEMANMVWGIEEIVPDGISAGVRGRERVHTLEAYLRQLADPDTFSGQPNPAELQYRLSDQVPANWIPFIPIRMGEEAGSRQIQLQRAALPRLLPGLPPQRIRPRTTLLRQGITEEAVRPYYLFEEEIPRAGVLLNGRWKRARWLDGRTFIWYAREKAIGRGEEAGGLRFDFLQAR